MKIRNLSLILSFIGFISAYGHNPENGSRAGILDTIAGVISSYIPSIYENPYKNSVAQVRFGNELAEQEQLFVQKRQEKIKNSLQQVSIDVGKKKVPTVALVCSGGGYRAMLYTAGALRGAFQTGLLDYVTYIAALSGSTWAVANWLSSGKSVDAFHDWLIDNLCMSIKDVDEEDVALAGQILVAKYWAGQPIGFVDFYGAFIANDIFDFFSDDKNRIYLSEQTKRIQDASVPFPIYTAISGDSPGARNCWYEFTPHEVSATWLGMSVPTWSFGRRFENGVSISSDPEQPLCTLLGTFGLAIGATVKEMLANSETIQSVKASLLKKIIQTISHEYGDDRPISAYYHNFAYALSECPMAELSTLRLVDAGLNMNIPYQPFNGQAPQRTADIIIIIDASAGQVGLELRNVENYARANGLKFPEISYTDIEKQAFSIFKDEKDAQTPIVIYVPRIVDEFLLPQHKNEPMFTGLYETLYGFDIEQCIEDGACNTFNFFYSKEEARRISALGECNIKCAYEACVAAIKQKLEQQIVSIS